MDTPMDVIRMGVWSFTVLHLMFLVPKTGFHWIGWYVGTSPTTVLGGVLAFLAISLFPVVLLLEAWQAKKQAALNKIGLVLFALIGLTGVSMLGFGLPYLYNVYLQPNGFAPLLPSLMVIGGGVIGIVAMLAQKLILR